MRCENRNASLTGTCSAMKFSGLPMRYRLVNVRSAGYCPISTLEEMENYADLLARGILDIISLYRNLGTYAFNMSIFFDKSGNDHGFRAFCSMISRINPNPSSTSDSAFMERLHLEPVIMTLPEDLGKFYKKEKNL